MLLARAASYVVVLVCAALAMPHVDHGQYDALPDLTEAELANPVCCMLNEESYDQLVEAHAGFSDRPCKLQHLNRWIREQIPAVDTCYRNHANVPKVFHIEYLLDKLGQGPNPPHTSIYLYVLQCLPFSPPKDRHPLNPNAPEGPTTSWVRTLEYILGFILPNHVLVVHDTFPVCIVPPLDARAERLELVATGMPTPRMMNVARILLDLFIMSLEHRHNATIEVVSLGGYYAQRLAQIRPAQRTVNLTAFKLDSRFFGMDVEQKYHPRMHMYSKYRFLRSHLLLREVLYLFLHNPNYLPVPLLYDRVAILAGVQVDPLPFIVAELDLDLSNPQEALAIVSQAIKDFVGRYGMGTHRQGDSTAGLGGCVVVADMSDAEVDRLYAKHDMAFMRDLLVDAGFEKAGELEDASLAAYGEEALPVLQLKEVLASSGDDEIHQLLEDETLLLKHDFARQALNLLKSNEFDDRVSWINKLVDLAENRHLPKGTADPDELAQAHALLGKRVTARYYEFPDDIFDMDAIKWWRSSVTDEWRERHDKNHYARSIDTWRGRLEPLIKPRIIALPHTLWPVSTFSGGKDLIKSLGLWMGHYDHLKGWKNALEEMNVKIDFNPTFGTPETRKKLQSRVEASEWWRDGMSAKWWRSKTVVDEALFWLLAFSEGGLTLHNIRAY
ncbi:hypothetical protein JCM3770_004022 [Rhodotorula araucariae]